MDRRIFGLENEYGVTRTLRGHGRPNAQFCARTHSNPATNA